ncbi:MAG TPA: pitrilysin family protein [Methylocella sp.]|nr:pitrilysin family protein [Methylocella sp.]
MSVEITTLPSGLRIITDRMPHLETASIGVFVGAGSRHEQAAEHGLSHLLEHMAFKGTDRRSAREIAEEIEMVGGDLNAATSTEHTAYYAHVLAGDVPLALDLLADVLTGSTFEAEELEREKNVILHEIRAVEDTPDDLIFEMLNAAAFPDQPIGRPILGTAEQVSRFDRGAISAYLDTHYRAGTTVIAAAGALEHAQVCEEAERLFARLRSNCIEPEALPARYQGGDKRVKRRLEQVHIAVGFEGTAYKHEDFYAAQIFANAAGGCMSSRLFQEVREARGLAYSISAFHWAYSDTGVFGFYAATDAKNSDELMRVALDCLGKAALDLSDPEIKRAKAQMKVSLLAALESPAARCEQVARQMMAFDRIITRDEITAAIDRLDVWQIRAVGARALKSAPTIAAIGTVAKVFTPDRVRMRLQGI